MKINEINDVSLLGSIETLELSCFPDGPWTRDMIEAVINAPFRHVFALFKNDIIVGYAIMQILFGEGEVERIGVAPDYRGQSFGKTLLLNILNEQALDTCFLEVSEKNRAARALYHSCAFEEIGKRQAYYHDGTDAIMMKWKRTTDE